MRFGVREGGYRLSRMGQMTPLCADKGGRFAYFLATYRPDESNGTLIVYG